MFKKILACCTVIIGLFGLGYNVSAEKKVIAVMDVTAASRTPMANMAREDMYQSLVTALVHDGKFIVVERQQLGTVLKELNLHETGLIDPSTVIEMGHMTGSQYTFIGNIVSAEVIPFENLLYNGMKAKIKLNYKIIDNKTGRLMKSEIVEASSSTNDVRGIKQKGRILISRAVKEIAEKVLKKMRTINPLDMCIVEIEDKNVYINVGIEDGIKEGDIILVLKQGKKLVDPKTGEDLGCTEQLVGKMKVKTVYEKYAVCEIKSGEKKINKECVIRKENK